MVLYTYMASYNPDRMAFNIPPEVRIRLQTYTVQKGYGHRGQSDAVTHLLVMALEAEGF